MLPEFKLAELLHALLISSLGGLVRALTRFAFRQPGARWAPLFLLGALDVLAGAFAGYLVYRLGNWARVDGELQAFYIGAAGASGTLIVQQSIAITRYWMRRLTGTPADCALPDLGETN